MTSLDVFTHAVRAVALCCLLGGGTLFARESSQAELTRWMNAHHTPTVITTDLTASATEIKTGVPDVVAYESVDLEPERGAFGSKRYPVNARYFFYLQTTPDCLPGHVYKFKVVIAAHADDTKLPAQEFAFEADLDTLQQNLTVMQNGFTPRVNGAHLRVSIQLLSGPPAKASGPAVAKGKDGSGRGGSGGKQSREETVTWLRTRLVGQTMSMPFPYKPNGQLHLPIIWVELADNYLIIRTREDTGAPASARFIINLAEVSPDIALGGTFDNDPNGNLLLTLTPTSSGALKLERKSSSGATPEMMDCTSMSLPFTRDEDLAQRVAKAISHLVHLSGGKKEAF